MSKITSPILLDTTGKDINSTLRGISNLMSKADRAFIDDGMASLERVWSSAQIIDSFTVSNQMMGSEVNFNPVSGSEIVVVTPVENQTTLVLTHTSTSGEASQFVTVIPCKGEYNWSTGEFTLPNGAVAHLNRHSVMAFKGTNTLSINEGTLTAIYRTVAFGDGSGIIYGGTAQEV